MGQFMARKRWWVLGVWLIALIALGVPASGLQNVYRDVFSVPGTNSQSATDLLNQRFPTQQQPSASVVVSVPSGSITSGDHEAAVNALLAKIKTQPGVQTVSDPFGPLPRVSADGKIAVANIVYRGTLASMPTDAFKALEQAAKSTQAAGVDVQYGGPVVDIQNSGSGNDSAELIGIIAAIMILLFLFGSVLAAFLPIGVALFGVSTATVSLMLLATQTTIGTVAPILGSMIGLGVGIDYSLLVLSRYLQNRDEGMDHIPGIGHAVGTAGAASLFAGCCVAMALCGLAIAGIPYVAVLGFSAGLFVVVMVLASLTLLPALLGFGGRRIAAHHRNVEQAEDVGGIWYKFAHAVANRAGVFVVVSVLILAVLAAPILDLKLGFTDDGDAPVATTQRKAYDLITQGFGEGANSPLLVAIGVPTPTVANAGASVAAVEKLATALGKAPDVASVTPAIPGPDKNAAIVLVTPRQAPNAASTQALVRNLRETVIPQATAGTVLEHQVFVGGQTASLIDVTDRVSSRLLECIGIVVLGAFLLLMIVFRSVLVPIKAAVMNLLSIGAAYGVIVAVFQWGWGRELIGVHQPIPIVAFIPLMMFAILFGLSMDYEVFLLSRIREEYLRLGDSREAVAVGVAKTARVITAAAGIMIAVFLGFVISPNPTVKMMGVGMAAAVLIDATVVRLLLVPAVMRYLGDAAWWLPKWLDRILPHLDLEGAPVEPAVAAGSSGFQVEGTDAPAPHASATAGSDELSNITH
ncbi:MAG: MMPL family transporter [Acidimicrobiia bacterium]